jgi:hypothetical protein
MKEITGSWVVLPPRLVPRLQCSPRLHEFLNQPWRRQPQRIPARVVASFVKIHWTAVTPLPIAFL